MTWEQTLTAAQEKGLSVATDPTEWFDDFKMAAVRPKIPDWIEPYSIMKSSEVRNKTLTYQTVANDFREAASLSLLTETTSPSQSHLTMRLRGQPFDSCERLVCSSVRWDGRIQTRRPRNASQ